MSRFFTIPLWEVAASLRKRILSLLPLISDSKLIWPELVFLKAAMEDIFKPQKIMNAYTQGMGVGVGVGLEVSEYKEMAGCKS